MDCIEDIEYVMIYPLQTFEKRSSLFKGSSALIIRTGSSDIPCLKK